MSLDVKAQEFKEAGMTAYTGKTERRVSYVNLYVYDSSDKPLLGRVRELSLS